VESTFLDVDGIRTHVLSGGSGPPLLLVHGGAYGECATTSWGPVLGPLARHHRVVAPDLLGFGRTDKVRDFVDLLGRIRTHLARTVELLGLTGGLAAAGLSMGGLVLLRDLTADAPLLPVTRAVLVSAGGPAIAGAARAALDAYDGTPEAMARYVALSVTTPVDDPVIADLVRVRHAEAARPGAAELFASLALRPPGAPAPAGPPPDTTPYGRVRVPVLVTAGGADGLKPPGYADAVAAAIPGARLRTFPGAGHCLQLDRPEEFVAEVLAFTRAADAAPAV
jgi:pimeloyl-ACP methyl ester carboxylesterase